MKWITRERARVDRIACPWLISRFIDAKPEFLFVPAGEVLGAAQREQAIPYDVPNVELGHQGRFCSFDAFIDRYELADPGLAALAPIVRGADTDDRALTPESAGLYAAATGFQATSRDDFDNMARQFPMYDAFYEFSRLQAATTPARQRVLFVCLHGAAKSVVAAAHFRRLAAARGLSIDAAAAGTEPEPALAPGAVKGLAGDGLPAAPARPRPVTLYDLASATRVVSFGCDITPTGSQRVDQWEVPAVSDGYAAARERIVANVERLVSDSPEDADMPLQHLGFVDLPAHARDGGFDHAAVHEPTGRVYVAHTANDALDVIDIERQLYLASIPDLPAVAGALVAAPDLVFTSNRGEDSVGVLTTGDRPRVDKIAVGVRPNGLAYDPGRARLLVAHVGDPAIPGSHTVSIVDVRGRKRIADIAVAGRTRWTVYDPVADAFHVNIADPPQIVVVGADDPVAIRRVVVIPHAGPHGLDIDVERRRLFCACDAGVLLEVEADRGGVLATEPIAGVPDVVFFNRALGRLYVAIGDPGVIEVFDTAPLRRHETIVTEAGAHTLSFDATRNIVCAFLPASHRAAVYRDHA